MRKVVVYLNDDSNYLKYVPGNRLRKVYEGELDREGPDWLLCDYMFSLLNMDHPADYHERSLSCGDVVAVDGQLYSCEVVGWEPINLLEATNPHKEEQQ